jgi:hypothetical protein
MRDLIQTAVLLGLAVGSAVGAAGGQDPATDPFATPIAAAIAAESGSPAWLKGQLHAHTEHSFDSDESVGVMMEAYAEAGFDFVVVTDHNVVTDPGSGPLSAYPGAELGVLAELCTPDPLEGDAECRVHLNVLLSDVASSRGIQWPAAFTDGSPEGLSDYLFAAADSIGGLIMVSHPNRYGVGTGSLLFRQWEMGASLVEIANMAHPRWLDPDPELGLSTDEELWDEALTAGARLYGVATDDAHDASQVGAGWVMVWAEDSPGSITAALAAGDFYASTGPVLLSLERADTSVALVVDSDDPHLIEWIGPGGAVLRSELGSGSEFARDDIPDGGYVRARITSADGARAWVQPIWAH